MAGVDSAGLGEVIHNLIPSFIESRSRNGTLDYIVDRAEVIQVFSLYHLVHLFCIDACLECLSYWLSSKTARTRTSFDINSTIAPATWIALEHRSGS
jgi:hypothetical protein